MSNNIKLRGVIVPSDFDMELFANEIDKGLITPLSRFESDVNAADPREPLELYINSPGGSVFAANEMLNVLVEWRTTTAQPINITVGAMAASAASMIATALGPVDAHQNSLFMFHSAISGAVGGPESMEDMADLLEKINAQTATRLISRYGVGPDMVAEWFSEGRQGWLTASEAQKYGLVDSIVTADDPEITIDQGQATSMADRGLKVAAMLEPKNINKGGKMNVVEKIKSALGIDAEEPEQIGDQIDAKLAEKKREQDMAYDEGVAEGKRQAKTDAEASVGEQYAEKFDKAEDEHTAEIDERDKKIDELTADKDKLESAMMELNSDIDDREEHIGELQSQLESLTGGLKDKGDGASDGTTKSYWDLVAEMVEDGASKNHAMLTIQRSHPELHKEMLKANKK